MPVAGVAELSGEADHCDESQHGYIFFETRLFPKLE